MNNTLVYPHAPVQSIQDLCRDMGYEEPLLRSIAQRAPRLYIGPKPKSKKGGGIRYVFDTKQPLKDILRRINRKSRTGQKSTGPRAPGTLGT